MAGYSEGTAAVSARAGLGARNKAPRILAAVRFPDGALARTQSQQYTARDLMRRLEAGLGHVTLSP
jgi:hypothetical protein